MVSVHVHSIKQMTNGLHLPLVLTNNNNINNNNNQQQNQQDHLNNPQNLLGSSLSSMSESAPYEASIYLPYDALIEYANDQEQIKVVFVMYRRLAGLLRPYSPSSAYESSNGQSLSPSPSSIVHLQPYAYQHYQPSTPFDSFNQQQQYDQLSYFHPYHHSRSLSGSSASSTTTTIVNSDVVGLIMASRGGDIHSRSSYDRLSTPLSAPLELILRHLQIDNVTNGRCAFWDIKRNDWSTIGCETVFTNQTHTFCRCNHLTNFAVLMDVTNSVPVS